MYVSQLHDAKIHLEEVVCFFKSEIVGRCEGKCTSKRVQPALLYIKMNKSVYLAAEVHPDIVVCSK